MECTVGFPGGSILAISSAVHVVLSLNVSVYPIDVVAAGELHKANAVIVALDGVTVKVSIVAATVATSSIAQVLQLSVNEVLEISLSEVVELTCWTRSQHFLFKYL